ncbi:MFS transporter [Thiovibrio frasassiensis]|uniref:MFS transporter n=1 Tax=Thiovibrio frasassiensis TaxID=2984131 RepID=A0A9X4MG24_9BACT|nr:MFS transporter [Thiovibrio frasassiensis]MDG4476596.1 MFS transporter [Thiovibrio frasassiensis]
MTTTENKNPGPQPASPRVWAFTTYFCEGLPYSIIRTVSAVFFRDNGVGLEGIGLTSLFGLPWALKFFWAPHLDRYGSKRQWLLIMQILLAGLLLIAAALAPLPQATPLIGLAFGVGSFLAATHDIAIDGYYLETLDAAGQSRFIGYRVMAYRIAMMAGAGIIATIGTTMGWSVAFGGSALILTLFFAYHHRYLPESETVRLPLTLLIPRPKTGRLLRLALIAALAIVAIRLHDQSITRHGLLLLAELLSKINLAAMTSMILAGGLIIVGLKRRKIEQWLRNKGNAFFSEAFFTFMAREKIGPILAFIVLIRTGEYMLSSMVAPFMVDLGIKKHYGWISGGVGLPFSIIGAMLGGWLISKYSLKKMIWPLLLAQNFTNLAYMFLALKLNGFILLNTGNPIPAVLGTNNLLAVVCVHAFDQLAGGLGTAVLMVFLMQLCQPRFKAAHYAIGTGLMSFSGMYAGVLSGFLASWAGYGYFFGISFLLSLPGMGLIFFIPLAEHQQKEALR